MSDALGLVSALDHSPCQAQASTRRLGAAIVRDGSVDFEMDGPRVVAVVMGPVGTTRRRVTFVEERGTVRWSCTCMSTPSPWCKHVVAAVIAATEEVTGQGRASDRKAGKRS